MITVSDQAFTKLKEMLSELDDPKQCLRVFITKGGCDGYSYGMTWDAAPEADDQVIERGGVRVLVDKVSSRLLEGAEIDYVSSVTASGFAIAGGDDQMRSAIISAIRRLRRRNLSLGSLFVPAYPENPPNYRPRSPSPSLPTCARTSLRETTLPKLTRLPRDRFMPYAPFSARERKS